MLLPPFTHALVLTGPTGSGKTQLGLQLAQRLDAEIISMDSMALYRGMDIGTAKPTPEERAAVRHHLIDVLEPWESSSVAWWLERATAACLDVEQRGKRVLFVGGTPLYLKALLCGLFKGPPADATIRARLEQEASAAGPDALHRRLAEVDSATAARLHPNDLRRVIRALEVYELSGKGISEWQTQWPDAACGLATDPAAKPQAASVLWLDVRRAELYERINRRVEEMFAAGLVDEVQRLRELGRPLSKEAAQALGYKEVLAHLDGRHGLADTIALIQQRTRNFAKRQITWFRHLPNCRPATSQLTWELWHPTIR